MRSSRVGNSAQLILALLAMVGCQETGTHERDAWITFERADGSHELRPVKLVAESYHQRGGRRRILEFVNYIDGEPETGGFRGLCGAPVIRDNGQVVGVFSEGRWSDCSRFGAMLEATDFPMLAAGDESKLIESDIRPGSCVIAAGIWGAVHYGVQGYVYLRKGNSVAILGHQVFTGRTGECMYGLFRAKPIGIVRNGGDAEQLCADVGLVGSVEYDGLRGGHATIGKMPRHLEISITTMLGSTRNSSKCYVASDMYWGGDWRCKAVAELMRGINCRQVVNAETRVYGAGSEVVSSVVKLTRSSAKATELLEAMNDIVRELEDGGVELVVRISRDLMEDEDP